VSLPKQLQDKLQEARGLFTKYSHSLERTKPVEGLSLEVLMLAVKSSDGGPSGLGRDRNIRSSCNGRSVQNTVLQKCFYSHSHVIAKLAVVTIEEYCYFGFVGVGTVVLGVSS